MDAIKVSIFRRDVTWNTKAGAAKKNWSWWARWRALDGRDRQKSLKTKDKNLALKMAVKLQSELNAGARPAQERLTWARAWELFEMYEGSNITARTRIHRRRCWFSFWEWEDVGHPPIQFVDEVSQDRVLRWRRWMEAQEDANSASTMNTYIKQCQTVVSKLRAAKLYAGENGFSGIKHLKEKVTTRDFLALDEIEVYLARARELGEEFWVYCALGIYAGLRLPSEGVAARWSWVHWSADGRGGHILIPKQDERFEVKDCEARAIPLATPLAEILRPRRGLGTAYIVAPHKTTWDGLYRLNFRKSTDGLRYTIPGKDITAYNLRHTFASMCVQQGVPDYKIMKWMGHTSLKMLMRYGHLAPLDDDIDRAFRAPAPRGAAEGGEDR